MFSFLLGLSVVLLLKDLSKELFLLLVFTFFCYNPLEKQAGLDPKDSELLYPQAGPFSAPV